MKNRTTVLSIIVVSILFLISGCDPLGIFGDKDSDGTTSGASGSSAISNYRIIKTTYEQLGNIYTIENEYNHSNGALCTKQKYFTNGTLNYYLNNTYDSNDNIVRSDNYDASNNLTSYKIQSNHNAHGDFQKSVQYANGISYTYNYSYVYDASGNKTVWIIYSSSTTYTRFECVYDDKGNPTSGSVKAYQDGSLISTTNSTAINVYDTNNNLIKTTSTSSGVSVVYQYTWEKY